MTDADAKTSVAAAISALDKAAEKGAVHPKNAARRKSRLMKALNKTAGAPISAPAVETTEKKPTTSSPKGKKAAAKK